MRFEKIHVTGFGVLQDLVFPEMGEGLNIIEGANEAGKTTLLEFIRALFFGFVNHKKEEQDAGRYHPADGGAHGGWAILQGPEGNRWRIERSSGRKVAGKCVVEPLGDAELQNIESLVGHIDRPLYEQVFAFSLRELDNLSGSKEQMGKRVYAASSGTSQLLPDALTKMQAEIDNIYKKNGKIPLLNTALREYGEQRNKIKQLSSQISDYNNDREAAAQQRELADELATELAKVSQELEQAKTYQRVWDDWVELSSVRAKLKELPETADFPQDGAARMTELRVKRQECEEKLREIEQSLKRAETEIEKYFLDEKLLKNAAQIEQLKEQLSEFERAQRELPALRIKLQNKEKDATAGLQQLGAENDESRLLQIDVSLTAQQEITRFEMELQEQKSILDAAEQKLATTTEQFKQQQEIMAQMQQELQRNFPQEPPSIQTLIARQKKLRQADAFLREINASLNERQSLETRLQELCEQRENIQNEPIKVLFPVPAWIPFVVGAAAVVSAIWLYQTPIIAAAFAVLLLGIAGGMAWVARKNRDEIKRNQDVLNRQSEQFSKKESALQREMQARTDDSEKARKELQKIEEECAWDLDNSADIATIEDALQQSRDNRSRYENEVHNIKERQRELDRLSQAQQEQEAIVIAHKSTFAEGQTRWNNWLETHHLPAGSLPENVLAILNQAKETRRHIEERDEQRRNLEMLESQCGEFENAAQTLWKQLGRAALAVAELPSELRHVEGALKEQQQACIKREGLVENQQELKDKQTIQKERLEVVNNEIAALLTDAHCADESEFDQKCRNTEIRIDLEEKRDSHLRALEKQSGPGEQRVVLEKQLDQLDRAQVERNVAETQKLHEDLNEKSLQARELLGELNNKVNLLEKGETELTAEQRRLEEQKTTITDLVERWAQARITYLLLDQTRARFEKERQPAVIKRAGELMSAITNKRYSAAIAFDGLDKVELDRGDLGRKPLWFWSRGTREQFYLALRLAFVEYSCKAGELKPLPLVMDDVLVHSDGYERLAAASRIIADFAENHQVLYFTCRHGDADALNNAAPSARRFRLERGKLVAM